MSNELSARVNTRLRGLAEIARGMDTSDPKQFTDRVWILATINDVCDYVDELRGNKSDIVPLYDADLNPIERTP